MYDYKNRLQLTEYKFKTLQTMEKFEIDFEAITLRLQASHRGGGIEIDLSTLGYEGEKMTAYQNYLGGGLLGSIGNDCTLKTWKNDEKLVYIADQLARYFHSITNPEDDEWSQTSFERLQLRPKSGY